MNERDEMKARLLSALGHGECNAVPGPRLRSMLRCRDIRQYRALMADLTIHEGIPILGDAVRGYWLAATDQEIEESANKLAGQAVTMLLRASRVRKLKPYVTPGQQRMVFTGKEVE